MMGKEGQNSEGLIFSHFLNFLSTYLCYHCCCLWYSSTDSRQINQHVFLCPFSLCMCFEDRGFPDSSVGKESSCNAGDPSSIPGSGRSPGEGTGSPLQCSWASLVAQLVKDPSAVQESWVRSLGWEDLLEKGKATHSSFLAWRIPWTV